MQPTVVRHCAITLWTWKILQSLLHKCELFLKKKKKTKAELAQVPAPHLWERGNKVADVHLDVGKLKHQCVWWLVSRLFV